MQKMKKSTSIQKEFKLLIIDSDKTQTRGMALALDDLFSEIVVFHSPIEALRNVEKNEYEIIITEISFPTTDGIDMVQNLKQLSPGSKIIIYSAHFNVSTCERLKKSGFTEYIEKPVSLRKLKNKILLLKRKFFSIQ